MSPAAVELAVEAGIARLTLARPKAGNAIDRSLVASLRANAESLADRPGVRAVLLRGEGPNFCVGGDLSYFSTLGDDVEVALLGLADDFHAGITALRGLDAPVIAAVQGAAAGGGLSLVCAADLVLAAESARFTMAYTGAGLSPDGGASWFLPRVVGLRFATEMLLTNRLLSAAEARDAGIVNEVIADESLDAEAEALARRLAAGATRAFESVKRLLQASATAELAEQLRERKRERSLETPQAPTVVRASARFLRSASRVSPAPREGLLLTDHEFPPGVLSDTFGSTYCWRIMVTAIVIEIRSLSPHRSVPTVQFSRPSHDPAVEPGLVAGPPEDARASRDRRSRDGEHCPAFRPPSELLRA